MKNWIATQDSFQNFLHWLDEGVDSAGEKYLEMHRRLVAYFDRKNCLTADDLADETLGRVAQKLQEKGEITELSPAHYCYVTAKFVFLEYLRHAKHGRAGLEEFSVSGQPGSVPAAAPLFAEKDEDQEKLLSCLDSCLNKLSAADSKLILEYYQGEKHEKIERRRELGSRLGLSANALSIRACRIRTKVEQCVKDCCKSG
ncbi:MAG TPA: sigma-70 family RNA polymerase sigma factor [Candidatus Angelobacter sp.]